VKKQRKLETRSKVGKCQRKRYIKEGRRQYLVSDARDAKNDLRKKKINKKHARGTMV